jgi:RNA polymerase sigma factor (sigma-70 family)
MRGVTSPARTHATIAHVARTESAKVVARLARMLGDVARAEELAQEALVAALERWPASGIPDNPGAWLMATAKHRAIDELRRARMQRDRHEAIARESEGEAAPAADELADDAVGDDLLRLFFVACHPVLTRDAQVSLTLRLLGGLTTAEIARAFLAQEQTIAQRIVRAKRTLAEANVPFEVPHELAPRLDAVLEVVYLIFNEGYAASSGDDWMRPALCDEAIRLGRLLVELVPAEAEAHGLLALMEIQASRAGARTTPEGEPILLAEQDRALWDPERIARGLAALTRAEEIGRAAARGPYTVQAAIGACHARAASFAVTDWSRIASLYDELYALVPSPVVALNRAVAVGMASGPQAGLEAADAVAGERALAGYHLLPAVRADFLAKLGRSDEARRELERAAALAPNDRERRLLLARAQALPAGNT